MKKEDDGLNLLIKIMIILVGIGSMIILYTYIYKEINPIAAIVIGVVCVVIFSFYIINRQAQNNLKEIMQLLNERDKVIADVERLEKKLAAEQAKAFGRLLQENARSDNSIAPITNQKLLEVHDQYNVDIDESEWRIVESKVVKR